MANRGQFTPEVKAKMETWLGRESNIKELRLLPYIQYIMMNSQKLDPGKIDSEERDIFMKWKTEGYVEGGMTGVTVTREFWDFINDICFMAYVDID